MTFEEKIEQCFQNFNNIDKPDYTESEINYYSDFVELIALFSKNTEITFSDIQDRFFGEKEYPKENAEIYKENAIFEDDEDIFSTFSEDAGMKKDKDLPLIEAIFNIIKDRSFLYSENYPFVYSREDNSIILKQNLSHKNKLYISLLISSKLNIFNAFKTNLTTDFETLSYNVLSNFLPKTANIREFGKNTQYQGNVISKIKQLAKDLDLQTDDYELNQISERNTQERGLDIIGWLPFADKCGNKVIFLCQCACGKEYESKQHDTRRFENYLKFYKTKPQHTIFIPYSLINVQEKKFYHSDLIEQDYLVFERKRIIEYHNDASFENSESFKIVNKCLEQQFVR
ncbi:MAG: hypothetical protein LBG92_04370 [Prevotellaceae bacterium]|jgi:hypothetical protein|nr:hypothetical protein [Prevotellaceae bacterium]